MELTLQELKEKIALMISLDEELSPWYICSVRHDGVRGYVQTMHYILLELKQKYPDLTMDVEPYKNGGYSAHILCHELKLFALATEEQEQMFTKKKRRKNNAKIIRNN